MDHIENEIQRLKRRLNEAKLSIKTETDFEMKKLIEDEILTLNSEIASLEEILKSPVAQRKKETAQEGINPNTAILEIRAGTGGDEASLFASDLFRMYKRLAERRGWKVEIYSLTEAEGRGIKTLVTMIKGSNVYDTLKSESGVHRVQRVPITEASGRIHTSTATVAILPEISPVEVDIKPEDIRMDFYRSGGHGGQNVNKVSTAVRLTHIPTGVVVECQEERTQGKNRDKAMQVLRSRLYEIMKSQQAKDISEIRTSQIKSADRSEKIRTYNYPQNRITDHRIQKSWHNLPAVMDGELDEMLTSLNQELG